MNNSTPNASERAGLRPRRRPPGLGAIHAPIGYGDPSRVQFTPPCAGCKLPLRNDDPRCPRCARPVPWAE